MGVRLFEAPLPQVVGGLGDYLYDGALAMASVMESGVVALSLWQDPLVVVIPARHPLLEHKRVPLKEVVRYPLVLLIRRRVESGAGNLSVCCAWWRYCRSWPSM